MIDRSSLGAIGVLVAGMALAALAAQSRAAEEQRPKAPAPRVVRAASAPALRALRDGERLAINAACAEDLELLPGVGPQLARRIVEYRAAHGPFHSGEELMQVRGIGERTLERLRELIRFEPAAPADQPADQSSKKNTTPAASAK